MTSENEKRRPVESRHSFAEMTDQEFAREFFIPERSEREQADSLPVDDDDCFDETDAANKWDCQL